MNLLLMQQIFDQPDNLTGFGMPPGLKFGIDQLFIHGHLVSASLRGDQGEALDLRFESLEQVICQAHGPVSIVSDSAIDDRDL